MDALANAMIRGAAAEVARHGLVDVLVAGVRVALEEGGGGHHVAMSQVVNLGTPIGDKFNVSAELWGQWDWDPTGTVTQYSADVAFAYLLNKNLQLDTGANFGLNRNTPGLELYVGVSTRF